MRCSVCVLTISPLGYYHPTQTNVFMFGVGGSFEKEKLRRRPRLFIDYIMQNDVRCVLLPGH